MDLDRAPAELRPQIERFKRGMTPTHELMAEWVLQNPGGTLKQMGDFFGYSISWLSQVTNSDMFKAHLATRMKDIQAVVTQDVPTKMNALAAVACDRMMDVLKTSEDKDQLTEAFDKVMHRYGYAPNAKTPQQPQGPGHIGTQNNFFLTQEQHEQVRLKLVHSHAKLPAPAAESEKEVEGSQLPHVEAVSTRD